MALPARNQLLEAYKTQSSHELPFRVEQLPLPFGMVLYEEDSHPRYVHFVTSGAASVVASLPDGDQIEVGFVGNEGFPESLFLLGPQHTARRCMVQVEGTALRVRFRDFQEAMNRDTILQRLTSRWMQYEGLALGQIAACNGLHRVEQRLARWLLMVQDRIGRSELPLTQDLLANMLGSRRSSVTQAAGNLERAGLIDWRRGSIAIVDRPGLENAACSCYSIIHKLYDGLYR
jgi:CRP-like cAMP-binding protein